MICAHPECTGVHAWNKVGRPVCPDKKRKHAERMARSRGKYGRCIKRKRCPNPMCNGVHNANMPHATWCIVFSLRHAAAHLVRYHSGRLHSLLESIDQIT